MTNSQILALPCNDPSFDGPEVLSGIVLSQKYIEQAGHSFQDYCLRKLGLLSDTEEETGSTDPEEDAEDLKHIDKEKMNQKKRKKKLAKPGDLTFYEALGLGHLGMTCTEKQVRSAHRKMVMKHHPDKVGAEHYDEKAKTLWLKIQEGYETLIDPTKRKKYDSTLEFNEFIPETTNFKTTEEFLDVFKPVFTRNSHFSVKTPVPDIGDKDTPIKKVEKFYDFWTAFKSWRDFIHEDEYDLEQAENRWERRHMEKDNKKLKAKLYKKEKARITRLVARAKNSDPRIKAFAIQKKLDEEKRKKEMQEKKKKAREEIERKIQEVKDKKQKKLDAEQEAKDKVKNEKLQKRKAKIELKNRLIFLCEERVKLPEYSKAFLKIFLDRTREEENMEALKLLEGEGDIPKLFKEFIQRVKERTKSKKNKKKDVKKSKDDEIKEEMGKWEEKDMKKLTKAISRFPVGTRARWRMISNFVGKKTVAQCTLMADILSIRKAGITKSTDDRLQKVINAKKKFEKEKDTWSQSQQSCLEKAIKTHSSKLSKKERWKLIAADVQNKSAKECFQRVKAIRQKLKNAKK